MISARVMQTSLLSNAKHLICWLDSKKNNRKGITHINFYVVLLTIDEALLMGSVLTTIHKYKQTMQKKT